MNETNKTVLFVFVALVAVVVAWAARPRTPGFDEPLDVVNQPLFPEFNQKIQQDPLVATSLELVQFDEPSGKGKAFKVAQVKTDKGLGRWSIPSHEDYPADAKDHLAEAAAALTDLTVLNVASESRGDFELYGVQDPAAKDLKPGASGVGMRVTLRDKDDRVLLDLIVGKELPDRKGLRYVRKAGQDPIYEVRLNTEKLSSNFGDWIEKDLLKLSTFDIKGIQIHDYSVDALAGELRERDQLALEYNDSGDPRWKLLEDRVWQNGKWVPQTMAADEELNTQKLDDMKYALGDLKIVDVNRKPAGLSGNLRDAGTLRKDQRSVSSLMQRGFYLVRMQNREELLSSEGEFRVAMKDGVVYVLRFGQIAGSGSASPKKEEAKGKEEHDHDHDKDKSPGVNRYLFVMAEFDPDLIEKPKLDPLPPEPKAEPKKEEAKKDDAKKDNKPDPKAERERIQKENKKKEDEYNEKKKKGEEHVKELNARFADWYYVIADDMYQKIHLGRKDLVKKKEKKEDEKNSDAAKAPANSPAELNELKGAVPPPKAPEAPKTEAPKMDAPKMEAPKPEAAKTPAPSTPPVASPAKGTAPAPASPPPAPAAAAAKKAEPPPAAPAAKK